jgi:uncharacterized membrane protein YfcA
MNKKYWLIIAAVIMTLVGVLRAIGGIALLTKGNQLDTGIPIIASENQIYIVATGLLIIGILFVIASINLIRNYSKMSWNTCWIVLLLFILGGLLNGFLLFGQPLDQGQKINLIAVILIGLFLVLGKPALKLNKQE